MQTVVLQRKECSNHKHEKTWDRALKWEMPDGNNLWINFLKK
jgi:hypothetical protein